MTVKAEFDFVIAIDGSMHTVVTYGEAMDRAEKATNKVMSAAYKYAAFQTFCIPTEGDNDADATTHTVASKQTSKTTLKPAPKESPKPLEDEEFEALREAIANASDMDALKTAFIDGQKKAKDATDKLICTILPLRQRLHSHLSYTRLANSPPITGPNPRKRLQRKIHQVKERQEKRLTG